MKQGDAKTMLIQMDGIEKYDIESITVIFKQEDKQDAPVIKSATYRKDGTGDAELEGNLLKVWWSVEDTYLFANDEMFYADYQIHLVDVSEMPSVEMTAIRMNKTLFEQPAEVDT